MAQCVLTARLRLSAPQEAQQALCPGPLKALGWLGQLIFASVLRVLLVRLTSKFRAATAASSMDKVSTACVKHARRKSSHLSCWNKMATLAADVLLACHCAGS